MKFSEQDLKLIEKLNKQGYSQNQIGQKFGVSGQYISRILRKTLNAETNVGGFCEPRSKIKEKHQKVLELWGSGQNFTQISATMNLSYSGVKYIVQKYCKQDN